MKNFDEFLKTIPDSNVGANTTQRIQEAIKGAGENQTEIIASMIVTTSYHLTINLLREYHEWLHKQS